MSEFAAAFAHQVWFVTGIALYAVLLVMVWTESARGSSDRKKETGVRLPWHERLSIPLAIAMVGLFWNVASLASGVIPTHAPVAISRLLSYAAISALGWLPALVLQLLVENAVKHGIQPSLGGGEIRIAASLIPQGALIDQQGRVLRLLCLCLEIADTGAAASL